MLKVIQGIIKYMLQVTDPPVSRKARIKIEFIYSMENMTSKQRGSQNANFINYNIFED